MAETVLDKDGLLDESKKARTLPAKRSRGRLADRSVADKRVPSPADERQQQ